MKKLLIILLLPLATQAQTLEVCMQSAERNYPLIKKYDLISKTKELTLSNIQKGWLPLVSVSAQTSYQSAVTEWPSQMKAMYQQMGLEMQGLKKEQYRVGIDVQQTIYDGGSIRSKQDVSRLENDVQIEQTRVSLYEVRHRVTQLYFSVLLLDQQLQLYRDRETLLLKNEDKLDKLFRHGAAAECDWKAVRAERLMASQAVVNIEIQRKSLARTLAEFCGMEYVSPQIPSHRVRQPSIGSQDFVSLSHPQMRFFDARLSLADAQERSLGIAIRPHVTLFASGYYGYPGYNMFEDMIQRHGTLNGMVGLRLTWNISGLYTLKNDRAQINTNRQRIEIERDLFLFNSRLDIMKHDADIERFRAQLQTDDEIITLRKAVRIASESKLDHGIIVASDLVRDINQESAACIARATHEIEMWEAIYQKMITTNEDITH